MLVPESSDSILPDAKRLKIDELSLRLQSFANAKKVQQCIVSEAGGPSSTTLFPLPQQKIQKLFVRKCYENVFDLLLKEIASGRECFGISGTPGIGKSLFFLYILFRTLKGDSALKPKRILYQQGVKFFCYDLEQHSILSMDPDFLLWRTDTLYVIDGSKSDPLPSHCVTLFISSPRSDTFQDFKKQRNAKVWYFPVWSFAELSDCRGTCYPLLPEDVLKDIFRVYGGVARRAFYDCSIGASDDHPAMETALADANVVASLRAIGDPSKIFPTAHTLLHMIVSDGSHKFPYQFLHVDIASEFVGDQLWARYHAQMIKNLKEMFGGSPSEISRHLFEIYGHHIFSKGGKTLKCRDLDDESETDFVLETLTGQRVTFGQNNLPQHLDSYYEPTDDDQFPAVDSMSRQGMFQFTVSLKHPIRGVTVLKKLCSLYVDPKLYFVVPPHRYASFQKQAFLQKQGNTVAAEISGLKQYVLQLEV